MRTDCDSYFITMYIETETTRERKKKKRKKKEEIINSKTS